ncbi:hypothetical protein ACOMHN_053681 [Nucella lapillus]
MGVCVPGALSVLSGARGRGTRVVPTGADCPSWGSRPRHKNPSVGGKTSNNVPSLRRSQLTSLPALEELTLTFAYLRDLEEDALSSLNNLKRLNLHDNQVRILTPRTFAGRDKLHYLDMTNNEGCVIQGDVFRPLTSLRTLFLGGMGLREARPSWFKSLSNLESLDLHGNRLESQEPDFLHGLLNVKMVDLTGNQLQTLPHSLSPSFTSLPSLHLGDNPWHCNYQLRWFKQFRRPRHSSDPIKCATPAPLAFREVAKIPDGELTCLPPKILQCGGPYDVNKGSDVTMQCDVEGDPFPEVTWRTPGGVVADITPPGRFISPQKKRQHFGGSHGGRIRNPSRPLERHG